MLEVLLFFSLSNKIARLYSTFDNVIKFVNETQNMSEMFIFISVYNCKKIRAGVLGGLFKKNKKKQMVIHRNNHQNIQFRMILFFI
jgi:hypothetical protein